MRNVFARFCLVVWAAGFLVAAAEAAEQDARSGHAFVHAVDVGAASVTLAGVVYRVTPRSELLSDAGEPIRLGDLKPATKVSARMVELDDTDYVRYRGVRRGRDWMLERLQLVSRGPES